MENTKQNTYEDEIDLRELFKTIWDKKVFIILFTLLITIFATIYAYTKKPIYEAKVLFELGHYKTGINSKTYLLQSKELNKKLNVIFIDTNKVNTKYKKIVIPKGFNNFLELEVHADSNKVAVEKIKELLGFIKEKENEILKKRFENIALSINKIDLKLKNLNDFDIKNLQTKINLEEENLLATKSQLKSLEKNLINVRTSDYALLLLKQNEKSTLEKRIKDIKLNLINLNQSLDNFKNERPRQLREQKRILELNLLSKNNLNTQVIGKIITNDNPIKPRKKLIIVISFISGFILAVFLVFLMQFVREFKEEK